MRVNFEHLRVAWQKFRRNHRTPSVEQPEIANKQEAGPAICAQDQEEFDREIRPAHRGCGSKQRS
jgi:hypothetical protein